MTAIKARPPIGMGYPLRELRGLPEKARVDLQKRIIYGAAVMQLGELNDDRPYLADEQTLAEVVRLGNSMAKGLKARLSHPNASNDGIGKFLGRWRNFRWSEDGSTVLADLHLAPIAFRGKRADSLGQYVLEMADENPDMFGVSLAPVWDFSAMESLENSDGLQPMRFKKLTAADVVDEPAATRGGLFGDAPLSIATAPHKATQALDQLFQDAGPEVIRQRVSGFLETYLANKFGPVLNSTEDEMSDDNKTTLTLEQVQAEISSSLETALSPINEALAKLTPAPQEPPQDPPALSQQEIIAAERKRCTELNALARNSGLAKAEELAASWVEKGLSLVEAKASLADLAIAQNKLTTDAGDAPDDPDAAYKAEYRKGLSSFAAMGITEEDYIKSRKIDDGKSLL